MGLPAARGQGLQCAPLHLSGEPKLGNVLPKGSWVLLCSGNDGNYRSMLGPTGQDYLDPNRHLFQGLPTRWSVAEEPQPPAVLFHQAPLAICACQGETDSAVWDPG